MNVYLDSYACDDQPVHILQLALQGYCIDVTQCKSGQKKTLQKREMQYACVDSFYSPDGRPNRIKVKLQKERLDLWHSFLLYKH